MPKKYYGVSQRDAITDFGQALVYTVLEPGEKHAKKVRGKTGIGFGIDDGLEVKVKDKSDHTPRNHHFCELNQDCPDDKNSQINSPLFCTRR